MCIPFPEPWEREQDLTSLFTFRDFIHRRTMILKIERTLKHTKTAKGTLQGVNAFFTNLLSKM